MKVWIIITNPGEYVVDNSYRHIPIGEISGIYFNALTAYNVFEDMMCKERDKDPNWDWMDERTYRGQNAVVEFEVTDSEHYELKYNPPEQS